MDTASDATPIYRAELMMALSKATDLAMGQPVDHAMATAVLAVRLGEQMGLPQAEVGDAYYVALLRYIGCNADTYWLASIVGDEIALRADIATVDSADALAMVSTVLRHIKQSRPGVGGLALAREYVRGLAQMGQIESSYFPGHCEVAQNLARRLGFGTGVVDAVGQLYARWDGKGVPRAKGEAVCIPTRLVSLAHDAVTFLRIHDEDAVWDMARTRSSKAHWPQAVSTLLRGGSALLAGLGQAQDWQQVLTCDPTPKSLLHAHALDAACDVIADYADIKSPQLLDHSRQVAALAAAAGECLRLPAADISLLRRAGCLHDVGKVGQSAALWHQAPAASSQRDLAAQQLHAIYTRTVLSAPAALRAIGDLAALHHERADGSGYPSGLRGDTIPLAARILAAANAYCEMAEGHGSFVAPHSAEVSDQMAQLAAEALQRDAMAGHFDTDVVRAVLDAAGHRMRQRGGTKAATPAGLTEREIAVLRCVARGLTLKEAARQLDIAPKTADRHVQNIYGKIGVSTRAGATIFAMEHRLL